MATRGRHVRQQHAELLLDGNRNAAIAAWVKDALDRLREGASTSGHPGEIVHGSVSAAEALRVGERVFRHLVGKPKDAGGAAYLIVAVGTAPIAPGALTEQANEVQKNGFDAYVKSHLDVVVGVSKAGDALSNVEVATVPLRPELFRLNLSGSVAYLRGQHEVDDTEWSTDAVLKYEWPEPSARALDTHSDNLAR